jgi:hypothetical protein
VGRLVRRREFIAGLGGVAAGPLVAHAQPGDRVDCNAMAEVPVHNDALPSLTRQLGLFLEEAEALFGPRDRSFMLLGIEFTDGPNRLVYPNTRHDQIIIQLSNESRDHRDQALFQLAHETVHVLSPVDVGTTTALEEGLATYFSLTAPNFADPTYAQRGEATLTGKFQAYRDALNDVRALLSVDRKVIGRIRRANRLFASITAKRLRKAAPHCSTEVANRLTRTFTMGK